MSFRAHTEATLIGKVPSVIFEVWLGHDLLLIKEHWGRFIVLLLIVGLVYGFLWWRRHHRPQPHISGKDDDYPQGETNYINHN